jgi:hypothetical protein
VAFIQEEIAPREEEISTLESRVLAAEDKLKSVETTVKALVIKIDYAKLRLAAQERYLVDLLELNKQSNKLDEILDEVEPIPDQITRHKHEISILTSKIKDLIQELHAKSLVQDVSKAYLDALLTHRVRLLATLGRLKAAFSPIHGVPAEVWANIFQYRLEDDIQTYKNALGMVSIWHTPLVLSQVCSFWREVVHTEKDLWRYFIYTFRGISDPAQAEIWKHFSSFNSGSSVLLTSLDGTTPFTANTNPAGPVSPPTSAHVLIRGYNQPMPTTLSFNQANSLTIEMDFSPTLQFMNGVNNAFPKTTSLSIICCAHLPQLDTTVHQRRLPSLKMDLITFEPFGIEWYGHSQATEELHILHNGINHLRQHPGFQYEKLRVLGITPPDNVWMETVGFPLLRQLVLYGPKTRTLVSPQLIKLSQHPDIPRIRELGLLNWPRYTPPDALSWSIMPLILAIADQLRLVETIRCADSFIEGECLVALVKRLTDATTNQSPSKLKVVIVDCCSGITRHDCELITASVEKLIVYV